MILGIKIIAAIAIAIIELINTAAAEISLTCLIEGWISGCKWLHNFSIAEFKASALKITAEIIKTDNHSDLSIWK